jgi:hypothetical protein
MLLCKTVEEMKLMGEGISTESDQKRDESAWVV